MSAMSYLQYRPSSAGPSNLNNNYRSTFYGSSPRESYSSSKYTPSSYSNYSSPSYYDRDRDLNPLTQSTSFINNRKTQYQPSNYSAQNNALLQTVKDFSRDLDDMFYERKNSYAKKSALQYQTPKKSSYNWDKYDQQLQSTGTSSMYGTQQKQNTMSRTLSGNFMNDFFNTPKTQNKFRKQSLLFDDYEDQENDLNLSYNNYKPTKSQYGATTSNRLNTTYQQNNFFQSQNTSPVSVRDFSSYGVLPPNRTGKKYTLVLDMDETLTHTLNSFGSKIKFLVRPGCQEFLQEMSKYFEIVVFTAAMQEYADEILNQIDPMGYISHRLYRQHLQVYRGEYIKDLSVLGRDLSKTLIIDNLRSNFAAQPNNGFEISEFIGQSYDTALSRLSMSLKRMVENDVSDVRMYPIRA